MMPPPLGGRLLKLIREERQAQINKWGEQRHPDGTGDINDRARADQYREECRQAFDAGEGTWRHVALEEIYEALAEHEPEKLKAELIQTAAVLVAWIEDIESRSDQ